MNWVITAYFVKNILRWKEKWAFIIKNPLHFGCSRMWIYEHSWHDEEGDYLEIFIEWQSPTYGEEMGKDITLLRSESTNEVVGVGILNFKKRDKFLSDIKLNLPFEVNFSSLKI